MTGGQIHCFSRHVKKFIFFHDKLDLFYDIGTQWYLISQIQYNYIL